ncbi:MAG: hypothetical protein F6K56_09505 [Moorea sp. SIO3G5]|nr:hypothetical protein [Moorena sp. SIO3G5]
MSTDIDIARLWNTLGKSEISHGELVMGNWQLTQRLHGHLNSFFIYSFNYLHQLFTYFTGIS